MQRQNISPRSPPIHHPVPQRPVQVPVMQSPPPPPQSSEPYDNPYGSYGAQQAPQNAASAYSQHFNQFTSGAGGFFGDPMTAQMGFNVARAALGGSSEMAEKNISRYLSSLKPYFAVTNMYVVKKLKVLLMPWWHFPWARQSTARVSTTRPGESEVVYLPPREDLNAPDMYIPVISFTTYILLSALLHGLKGTFHPELLGYTASSALAAVIFELIGLKLGCYLLNISNSQLLDLMPYSGYKFVGVTISALAPKGWLGWTVFAYVYNANAFFLLRSLKYVLLPADADDGATMHRPRLMKRRRTWFLFGYSYVVQLLFMMVLSRGP